LISAGRFATSWTNWSRTVAQSSAPCAILDSVAGQVTGGSYRDTERVMCSSTKFDVSACSDADLIVSNFSDQMNAWPLLVSIFRLLTLGTNWLKSKAPYARADSLMTHLRIGAMNIRSIDVCSYLKHSTFI
jgi:hypothetical protein